MRWTLLILAVFLVSCAAEQQLEPPREPVPLPPAEPDVRPVVPRVVLPPEIPTQEESTESFERRGFLNSLSDFRADGLLAGSDRYPLLLGKTLGEVLPVLTRRDLPLLAMKMPSFRGQPLEAEAFIRFDFEEEGTGELRFARGSDDKIISEIYFEEGKIMFEYAYLLHDGAFPVMVDEEIDFFGATYVIDEASDRAIVLHGTETEQYLSLVNDSLLSVNGKKYADTRVLVDPYSIVIQYLAADVDDDGIQLRPGHSLRERLRSPEMLLNPIFDIYFDGIESNPNATLLVDSVGRRAQLTFFNYVGERMSFDIASNKAGSLVLGDGEHVYHHKECASFTAFCISSKDEFPVIARDGTMRIFEFRSVNEEGNTMTLSDSSGERHIVKVKETGTKVAGLDVLEGTLGFRGTLFKVRVLHNESVAGRSRISVDMDGIGGASGKEVPIALYFDYALLVEEVTDEKVVLLLEGNDIRRDLGTEEIEITLWPINGEVRMTATGNFSLLEDEDEDNLFFGMSRIGSFITMDDVRGGYGEELLIEYPFDYRAGLVRIEG